MTRRIGGSIDRAGLRAALRANYPWVADPEFGPSSVDAGECGRCQAQPRLVETCGPVAFRALCAGCATEIGEDGWCDGHAADGARLRERAAGLPPEWATVARLWWVATGEAKVDESWLAVARDDVSTDVRAAIG